MLDKDRNITEGAEKFVSFSHNVDLSYTKPVFASYFEEEIEGITSWKRLYVNVFKKLYEDYDVVIPINQSFHGGNGRFDFCTIENKEAMTYPIRIVDGKYLETNLSATNIVRKLKCLLDICLVDEENLIIKYVIKRWEKSSEETKESNKWENKNLTYKKADTIDKRSIVDSVHEAKLDLFRQILREKYPKGYRLNSTIERTRFKRYWQEIYGNEIAFNDEKIDKYLRQCGIVYDGKVHHPDNIISDDTKEKLFSYIEQCFQDGKSAIYYDAIYNKFYDDFLDSYINNASMLHAYLAYVNKGKYFLHKDFLSQKASSNADLFFEVRDYFIEQARPVKESELISTFSNISEKKLYEILRDHDEFINNGQGEYFYITLLALTDDELQGIDEMIQGKISVYQFMTSNELLESIKKKYPHVIEYNDLITEAGMRKAIAYMLREKYSFKGKLISSKERELSKQQVFSAFCENTNGFTFDELESFSDELGINIDYDIVYKSAMRVSASKFEPRTHASFNSDEIDNVIDGFCPGDYIPVGKIKQFGLFPDAGYPWNSYLLEQYVAMYSLKYKLLHVSYKKSSCAGGIVKKDSDIETFDDLVIDLLANCGKPLEKETALSYLFEAGYLARGNYAKIDRLLIKAKERRNRKGL